MSKNKVEIKSYKDDPELVKKVEEGLLQPFKWDPNKTTLEEALEQTTKYWQDPKDGGMPPGFVNALNESLMELVQSGLDKNAVQIGEKLPQFSLSNQKGESISSAELLENGPLVITFYRGGWCPYCNLALRALQSRIKNIRSLGAKLVAISPEKPDNSLSTAEKAELEFDILTDQNLELAEKLGIVWKIPESALEWHEKYFGLFLNEHNGAGNRDRLPVPVTLVVDTDGTINWRFIEADYWKRAEPDEIINALKNLRTGA